MELLSTSSDGCDMESSTTSSDDRYMEDKQLTSTILIVVYSEPWSLLTVNINGEYLFLFLSVSLDP